MTSDWRCVFKSKKIVLFLLVWCCSSITQAASGNGTTQQTYNILGIFSHSGKSHFDVFEPLLKALAAKGHNVTVLSHFPQRKTLERYRDVSLRDPDVPILKDALEMDWFKGYRYEKYFQIFLLAYFAEATCESGLSARSVQDFLKEDNEYDVIIAEMFNTDCFMGFAHKYKAPLIGISSCTIMNWMNDRFGNPSNPSHIPVNFMDYSDNLSFLERVENTVMHAWTKIGYQVYSGVPANRVARKYFGDDLPPVEDIARNASLLLVNTHFSLNKPRPFANSVVEVGGIHIGTPKKLPRDIEKWIEESEHGVILFSLGSMIKGHTFPEEKLQAFLKAFARLPQRVLWKWENETMTNKPDNVMIKSWLPQFDVLCHPNVKAFISHGGLLGTTEAVHCGVPTVAMPQYGDQHTNSRALEESGGGIVVQLRSATDETIYDAITHVLSPAAHRSAKDLSETFRDRPMPPLDTAVYWVEYVARHKGAPRMRSVTVDMPLYQYLLLDVVAFITLVLAVLTLVVYKSCRLVLRKCSGIGGSKLKVN